jgi:hypothetical protein
MAYLRNPFLVWLYNIRERLRTRDPSDTNRPPLAAFEKFPALQAAYLEYLNAPLVWANIDRTAIEKAFKSHLAALNQDERPVRWFESFSAAHEHVRGKIFEAIGRWAKDCISGAPEGAAAASKPSYGDNVVRGAALSRSWSAAWDAACQAANRNLPWDVLNRWEPPNPREYSPQQPERDARESALDACMEAASRPQRDPQWSKAKNAAWRMANETARNMAILARNSARYSLAMEHAASEAKAQSQEYAAALSASAALRRAASAGLWTFWLRDEEIVAVPAPNLYTDDRGRLHRTDGPAVEWPGESYWFIEGEPAIAR